MNIDPYFNNFITFIKNDDAKIPDSDNELYTQIAGPWEDVVINFGSKLFLPMKSLYLSQDQKNLLSKMFPDNNLLLHINRLANNDVFKYLKTDQAEIREIMKYIIFGDL